MAILTALALAISMAGPAAAKMHEEPISCSNDGSQLVDSKTTCPNDTLTQDTENQNPAGHAPRGQN